MTQANPPYHPPLRALAFGLLLAYAMVFPNRTIMPIPPIPISTKAFALLYGGLELILGHNANNERIKRGYFAYPKESYNIR